MTFQSRFNFFSPLMPLDENSDNLKLLNEGIFCSSISENFFLPTDNSNNSNDSSNFTEIYSNEKGSHIEFQEENAFLSIPFNNQLGENDYPIIKDIFNFYDNNHNEVIKKSNQNKIFLCEKIKKQENKELCLFTPGIYNNYSWKIINEALNDNSRIINKKRKLIKNRKQNSDNVRKKIKARFLKALIKAINKKLKMSGSKYFFSLFQQSFISNLSKGVNSPIVNLTLGEIFSKNFFGGKNGPDIKKYKDNNFVLNYLEKHPEISEKSNFNKIRDMKYSELFNEYFISKEFEEEIYKLKQEKENDKYIKNYIIKSKNFINFFSINN